MNIRTFIAILALVPSLAIGAGDPVPPRYNTWKTTSLTSAAEVITVQNPSVHKHVVFKALNVTCSVACTFHIEMNGSAATTTALTVNRPSHFAVSAATAFSSSNVGVGTVMTFDYDVGAAPSGAYVDLTGFELINAGDNFTVRTNSITGTAKILIVWEEYAN